MTVERKEDKRVVKTKAAVKDALLRLLAQKDFKQISITDLAREAGINRATFYMHFNSTYEVVSAIGVDVSNSVINCLQKFDTSEFYKNSLDILLIIAKSLEGLQITRGFTEYASSGWLLNKLKARLIRSVYERMKQLYPEANEGKLYCTVTFTIAGLMESYMLWFTDDTKKVSLHELADLMSVYLEQAYNFMSATPKRPERI